MTRETERSTVPGGPMLALVILALIGFILGIIFTGRAVDAGTGSVPLLVLFIVSMRTFMQGLLTGALKV